MSEQILESLREDLKQVNILRAELKARSMVFQCEEKENVAIAKGLPLKTFYHLKFRIWRKVAKRYEDNRNLMRENRFEFEDYCGRDLNGVPYSDWYQEFGVWAKENGFYWY